VFAADVDGDGDTDVLSASFFDDKIAWYENDGSQNFTAHIISTAANGALSVFAADVDGDGDTDVLSASYFDDKIAWYENDGNQNFSAHTISTAADAATSVFAADVDGDGDLDVLSASAYDHKIAWYENRRPNPPPPVPPGPSGRVQPFGTALGSDHLAFSAFGGHVINVSSSRGLGRTFLGESSGQERETGGTNRPARRFGALDAPASWVAGVASRETLPFLDDVLVDALDS
jgi:hypothetical protein